MCGICGIFEFGTGQLVTPEQLDRMNSTMVHRGPDDSGYFLDHGIGMAIRRLSIIDTAGGHQPIANEDETIQIIFNGEIYNYQELRKTLQERGHRFRTQSDTEVIVHLYEDHGSDCVHHLDGMFAFAIYDSLPNAESRDKAHPSKGGLYLARDRLGKKPLYYANLGGTLIFASELKPILQDPRVSREIDYEALYHYLSLLMVPAPFTIFKAIRKLPAGHILECGANGIRLLSYWSYLDHVNVQDIPEQEAIEEIRRLLFAAVKKRLIAEVPLGAFLSGGMDSSAVVAIMSKLKNKPVKTFSIGFEGPETHNELPFAYTLAKHYRTEHYEFVAKPNIIELLPELVQYADEPFAISSAIPLYLIAKAARQHVTVALTGDGGDEFFGGYEHYLYERWVTGYRLLPQSTDFLVGSLVAFLPERLDSAAGRFRSRVKRFLANARQNVRERRLGWTSGWHESEKMALVIPDILRTVSEASTPAFLERQVRDGGNLGNQQMLMDILVWLPDEMLTKVDRMTMAASVEARCPLLDVKLVEFMAGIGPKTKIPGWHMHHLKHLLRRTIVDLIPNELLQRHKHGFNVPLDAWFRGAAKSFVASVLSPAQVRRRGIFEPTKMSELLERHWSNRVNASNRIYALLFFEIWAQEYLD
jgi:asparagine synthase (glutamine-hydrolysing)